MDASLSQYLHAYSIVAGLVRPGIVVAVLAGLWAALGRARVAPRQRAIAWGSVAVPLVVWLAGIWALAVRGAFLVTAGGIPWIPVAVAAPVAIAYTALRGRRWLVAALDATPVSWLVGLQVYRVMGASFVFLWLAGAVPGAFALPAGLGDALVGLLAIPVARWTAGGEGRARRAAIAWNVLGVADLVNALTLGFLSAPGPLQLLAHDHPNALVGRYPTVMTPAFAVPLSLILHGLSLWQLRRRASSGTPTRPVSQGGYLTDLTAPGEPASSDIAGAPPHRA